jgi:hypothetical protein
MCPVCNHKMALARIFPGERGFEERTFECSTCARTEKVAFAVDPVMLERGRRNSLRSGISSPRRT